MLAEQAQPSMDGYVLFSMGEGSVERDPARVHPRHFSSLTAMADNLKNLTPVANKKDSAYIVGARFRTTERSLHTLTGITLIQLDFDKAPSAEHFDSVSAALESLGVAHLAFSTFTRPSNFVVLIPLSRFASPNEHKATIDYLLSELGQYSVGFDPASYNAVLPRFISPNEKYPDRKIVVVEGKFLDPRPAEDDGPLPGNVTRMGQQDQFEIFANESSPDEKKLFLQAMRYNVIPEHRLNDYHPWNAMLYAAFRGWGITSTTKLNEDQKELIETIDAWSQGCPESWKPGCVEKELRKWQREKPRANELHIRSILTHEIDHSGFFECIKKDDTLTTNERLDLEGAYRNLVGTPAVTLITPEAMAQAVASRDAEEQAAAAMRMQSLTILAKMPEINERFSQFRDLLVAMTTQNTAEFWQLDTKHWDYFLRPAPVVMGMLQIAAMGFAPHVMFKLGETLGPKALNPYFLTIGGAATGKSEVISKMLEPILAKTSFKFSTCNTKLHSATGLWVNFFEPKGNIQLVFSEEAEALIGKNNRNEHLDNLHTVIKRMFDEGIPGRAFAPSAQVQRHITELYAPWMAMYLAATPRLLGDQVKQDMLSDGFMSRIIVSIDDREDTHITEAQAAKNQLELMRKKAGASSLEATNSAAAAFLHKLWIDGRSPIGDEFFEPPLDGAAQSEEYIGAIRQHFNEAAGHVRYITPPQDPEKLAQYSELSVKSEYRWTLPKGSTEDVKSNLDSLRKRSPTKLHILSSILTLISDPLATEINLELAKWAEKFLYVSQYSFYRYLVKHDELILIGNGAQQDSEFLGRLRTAIERGGPLACSGVDGVSGRELRNNSKAWRRLIDELKLPEGHAGRNKVESMLRTLEVTYTRGKNNALRFFYMKGVISDD